MRVRIKICGITEPVQARQAVDAGADALGLMFYEPSRRHLRIERGAEICQEVGPFVSRVGVFVNPEEGYLESVLKRVPLTHLQFHGEETAQFCRSFGLPYVKSVRVAQTTDLLEIESRYPDAQGLLLDTFVKGVHGGTGKIFDWNLAHYGGQKPLILAGGLDPENVADAIRIGRPYGVDVSSGVETEGVKDPDKMRNFCERVSACAGGLK